MKKELPKAYEPKEYEDEIYKKWEESGFFQPEAGQPMADDSDNLLVDDEVESYTISLPPPNVTGTLHMGHAAMLAIEDILVRFHRMNGYRTLWVPGTDHAAIATQTKVEKILKQEGTDRHKLGREKFLERVKEFAQESHDTIVNQVKKMGASIDWSREAYTLDATRHKTVYSVFKMMYDDGLIYRGERIVNWCPRCHSTLADDEVEYKEEAAKLYWIKYGPFVLATARPETKLGDTAVAVHPNDERYKDMVGKKYDILGVLGKFRVKVVADKAVDPEFGSGAIKVTPAHSFVDNQIAQRHGVGMKQIINEDGKMMDNCGKYAGMTTKEARKEIVKDMEKIGLIDHINDDYQHNIAVCYRCDTPIEPIPSEQWFINVNKKIPKFGKTIKELSIDAVRKGVFGKEAIKIVPKRFEKNYYHWMENLRDWCISRQIWYGHRIPVWFCRGNDKTCCRKECARPIVSLLAPKKCPVCGSNDLVQDPDTLDTWFSSGLWTFSTLARSPEEISIKDGKLEIDSDDFKTFHPTSVLETGYDILFFWVARMIIMTTYAVGDIPFKDVYLHGLVLDDKGKKMSKSKGNVIDPLDMAKKYGTDATRLSLIVGSTPGNDMKLSEEKIAGFRNFSNKLWNISRFILGNIEEDSKNFGLFRRDSKGNCVRPLEPLEGLTFADKWILSKIDSLIKEVTNDIKEYRLSQAGEKLREFTWGDLADWYLEVSKFEKNEEKSDVLTYVLTSLLKLWHPFIPFVTEVIWKEMGKKNLLMIEKWPVRSGSTTSPAVEPLDASGFEMVKEIISAIRNARAMNKVEPGRKIKAVIYAGKHRKLLNTQIDIIKGLRTGISELEIKNSGDKIEKAIFIAVGDIQIYLIGAIDEEKEKKRIKDSIKRLEQLIKITESKLADKNFVERAPAPIVDKEKFRLVEFKKEIENLEEQI